VKRPPNQQTAASYFDRQPPCDIQAEIGVLGSIVLLPSVMDEVLLIAKPEDFYDDAHAKLYRHFAAMHQAGKRIDPTLLIDRLRAAGDFEMIGGSAYLGKIINAVPNAAHATYYAEIVARKSRLRSIIIAATEALQGAYDELPAEDITTRLELGMSCLGHDQQAEARLIGSFADEALAESLAESEAPARSGVMSGLAIVDEIVGPAMPGELVTLAARTGEGKTALAIQIATHNAERSRAVLIVSLEMRGAELARRELASWAGVDGRDVRLGRLNDDDKRRLREAREQLSNLPVRIWAPPRATLADIRAQSRHWKAKGDLSLLVVDYVGLVSPAADDRTLKRYEQVGKVTAGLKALAKELELPVLMLAQLNREADGEEPRLSHLRESGAIEQDSDFVLFLHHPQRKPSATGPSPREDLDGREAYLICAKHRHGQTGRVRLNWHPQQTRFSCSNTF
jgi:replicative DNA helicase